MIYLDNAATTYPKPEVVYEALDDANRNHAFNAGRGSYGAAAEASAVIEETRDRVGALVGAPASSVVFTASATDALNQIINGLGLRKGDTVFVSPFEHNAIIRPLHLLQEKEGFEIKVIPFDAETWEFDEDSFADMLAMSKVKAVFVSQVSNVTGYILPYDRIFNTSSEFGAISILDASQGLGVIDVDAANVDFVVFAGHKSLYASFGVAGFVARRKYDLSVVKAGGTGSDSLNPEMPESYPSRYEAGSPNIVAVYGLNAALKWREGKNIEKEEQALTDYLVDQLETLDNVIIFRGEDIRPFGVVSFAVEGYTSADVGTILADEFDIAVRTGYHCAPLVHDFIESKEFGGTVRASLSCFSTKQDVDSLISAIESL